MQVVTVIYNIHIQVYWFHQHPCSKIKLQVFVLCTFHFENAMTTHKRRYSYYYVCYSKSTAMCVCVCVQNTRGHVERLIQHEAKPSTALVLRHSPSAVFLYTQAGGANGVILYFLVCLIVFLKRALILSIQITSIFGYHTISSACIMCFWS